jgi:hypothetical protein
MEDEFVSFVEGTLESNDAGGTGNSFSSSSTITATDKHGAAARLKRTGGPAKPLLRSVPKIVWLVVGCLLIFAAIFWMYYSRRKHTTAKKKEDVIGQMASRLQELGEELGVVAQKQNNMGIHLRNVATHSKSVEQGLSQALGEWTKTFDELRSEFEIVAGSEEEDGDVGIRGREEEEEEEEEKD